MSKPFSWSPVNMSSEISNPMGADSPESNAEFGFEISETKQSKSDVQAINISKLSVSDSRFTETSDNEDRSTISVADQFISTWHFTQKRVVAFYNHFHMPTVLMPFRDLIDDYFECTRNGSTVETEFFAGVLHFFSCMYILAVIPLQMTTAGFDAQDAAAIISLLTGFASIACGLITNLPLIIAPTTAISIYYVSNIRQYNLSTHDGNMAVSYAGLIVILIGVIGPLGRLMSKLIPEYIQYGVTIGIGLITVLSGLSEIDLVVQGKYTLLAVGPITNEIVIAISALILIAIGCFYHSKISYLIGLFWGTVIYWSVAHLWPVVWTDVPTLSVDGFSGISDSSAILLVFEIFLLNVLSIFGLAKAMCDLAGITPTNESIPRGRALLIVIGVANLVSGLFNGPPILISPESSSGIKAGSKTGLSSVVGGGLFILSVFFAPLFSSIPPAGTTPILVMIGLLLFQNVQRIDFSSKYGMPAFLTLTLIPFCDSIIVGIVFGYITYVTIAVLTGDFQKETNKFIEYYFPPVEEDVSSEDLEASTGGNHSPLGDKNRGSGMGAGLNSASSSDKMVSGRRPIAPRQRNDSSPAALHHEINAPVTRARRASMAFLTSVLTEGDLKTDFKGTMLRYDTHA